eukprot:Phypoly_transcript_02966.p1 GENE.Phypoly_transcript_02966~~Phypoly_transcript_02966.p1  ORF type:complete len:695 (+),score=87.59 Phypoly_transcript_02966:171-2087(+)
MAEVTFQRPDLSSLGSPDLDLSFSLNPEAHFIEEREFEVPDIGQVMLASFVVSSIEFGESVSAQNPWWLGEKYDGVRCIWNPRTRKLYTRAGIEISLHPKIARHMLGAHSFLDGEAWNGRGNYLESQRIVGEHANWCHFRLIFFDSPSPGKPQIEFEKRYASLLPLRNHFSIIAARTKCQTPNLLRYWVKNIIDDGGEGVILRKPRSFYSHGRSTNLVKLKSSRADCEALVLNTENDKVHLQSPSGQNFTMPYKNSDASFLGTALKRGSIVTLQFDHFSRHEIPVNPTFVRIRTDVIWEEIVRNYALSGPNTLNFHSHGIMKFSSKPMYYWTSGNLANKKKFLENFARKRGLDPLLPQTWYSFSKTDFTKEEARVFHPHGFVSTLMRLFPNIGLQQKMFSLKPMGYWSYMNNRKEFFDSYARENNFDPLIPSNWYKLPSLNVFKARKGARFLQVYGGNIRKALEHVYPNIGLESSNYTVMPDGYWDHKTNLRNFFISYARDNNFDPLVAENWYSQSKTMILSRKGQSSVLNRYNGSMTDALLDLFPEIGLEKAKFRRNNLNYWADVKRRRAFFDEFASENNFDPLIANNWYNVTLSQLSAKKFFGAVLHYYRGFRDAIKEIYPDVNIEIAKFRGRSPT